MFSFYEILLVLDIILMFVNVEFCLTGVMPGCTHVLSIAEKRSVDIATRYVILGPCYPWINRIFQ